MRNVATAKNLSTDPDGLVQTAADDVQLVKLQTAHWTSMTQQRTVRLANPHCERCISSYIAGPKDLSHSLSHIRTAPSPLPLTSA